MEKARLLLVEDEHTLADIIAYALTEKGFDVYTAYDGKEGMKKFDECNPDIVVTDIMMPGTDGLSLVKELREKGEGIPVLFLSARSSADDVVEGFESGGNDYLRKPFAMNELIARVNSLLDRNRIAGEKTEIFKIGKYDFDHSRCLLSGCKIAQREADVLYYLCRNPGQTVPSKKILKDLWGDDNYFNAGSLHVYITKLRNMLSDDTTLHIVNIRGYGYKLIKI
ncbi:MAG: response regulator transcription factor [Bacteroidales bacterium]|jgi:DNA-binding response OmpR family regulator|nr:response regulator transcription factor [Bacteroidales bacterium]